MSKSRISELLGRREKELVESWIMELQRERSDLRHLFAQDQLRAQCQRFLECLCEGLDGGIDVNLSHWDSLREHLSETSEQWIEWGAAPVDLAAFVLLLKRPLFTEAMETERAPADKLGEVWAVASSLDRVALWTTELAQRRLQQQIQRQQEELLELSTPVINLWDGILALPLIGTLDSARTQTVMESLLERIVATGADVAILDITGVPTVDTMVAQHLLKAITAARLMGATCIISGIRPSIAQTMVQLGIDLRDVTTKATLASAFSIALSRRGLAVTGCEPRLHEEECD